MGYKEEQDDVLQEMADRKQLAEAAALDADVAAIMEGVDVSQLRKAIKELRKTGLHGTDIASLLVPAFEKIRAERAKKTTE